MAIKPRRTGFWFDKTQDRTRHRAKPLHMDELKEALGDAGYKTLLEIENTWLALKATRSSRTRQDIREELHAVCKAIEIIASVGTQARAIIVGEAFGAPALQHFLGLADSQEQSELFVSCIRKAIKSLPNEDGGRSATAQARFFIVDKVARLCDANGKPATRNPREPSKFAEILARVYERLGIYVSEASIDHDIRRWQKLTKNS